MIHARGAWQLPIITRQVQHVYGSLRSPLEPPLAQAL